MENTNGYAGFLRRLAAGIIDAAIIIALDGLIALILYISRKFNPAHITMVLTMIDFGVIWLYFGCFECSKLQATPGKLVLGITVVDYSNQRIGFGRASGRALGKIISGLPYGFGFIMPIWTKQKQALHDFMAGTLVVRKGTEDSFFGLEKALSPEEKMLETKKGVLANMLEEGKLTRQQYDEALAKLKQ
ncbi:MAG: RDD family protein [Spirochaetales bacterium]|nr:RDD family protein [Spirochaetales bacterium]